MRFVYDINAADIAWLEPLQPLGVHGKSENHRMLAQ
jgi:hypothetical protein